MNIKELKDILDKTDCIHFIKHHKKDEVILGGTMLYRMEPSELSVILTDREQLRLEHKRILKQLNCICIMKVNLEPEIYNLNEDEMNLVFHARDCSYYALKKSDILEEI